MASTSEILKLSIKIYSKVNLLLVCFWYSTKTADKSSNGKFLLMGIIWSLFSFIALCSETANSIGIFSSKIFSIPGTIPDVEIVIFLFEIFTPFSFDIILKAFERLSIFNKGSPIPIKTKLFKFSPLFLSLLSTVYTWFNISLTFKFLI